MHTNFVGHTIAKCHQMMKRLDSLDVKCIQNSGFVRLANFAGQLNMAVMPTEFRITNQRVKTQMRGLTLYKAREML